MGRALSREGSSETTPPGWPEKSITFKPILGSPKTNTKSGDTGPLPKGPDIVTSTSDNTLVVVSQRKVAPKVSLKRLLVTGRIFTDTKLSAREVTAIAKNSVANTARRFMMPPFLPFEATRLYTKRVLATI